jgi:plasmid stabilization system protein ParE
MSREIVFRRVARLEFDEAVAWYEGERTGLGVEFREAVERTLAIVARQPELFRCVQGEVRRAVMRRFPYAIHFLHEDRRIIVVAVFHCHRDPAHLRNR